MKRHFHRHLLPSVDVWPSAAGQKRSPRTHRAQDAAPALLNARARTRRAAGQSAGRVESLALEKKVEWRYAPFGRAQRLWTTRLVSRWSRSAAGLPSGQRLNTSVACSFKSFAFAVALEGTKEYFSTCVWGRVNYRVAAALSTKSDEFHSWFKSFQSMWKESSSSPSSDIVLCSMIFKIHHHQRHRQLSIPRTACFWHTFFCVVEGTKI